MVKIQYRGTGRRKEAVARVRLIPGKGEIRVNSRDFKDYFRGSRNLEALAKMPLLHTDTLKNYDVIAKVEGGGLSGQAGALSLGIARALVMANGELRSILRKGGFLTRDPRMHERKKYGQPGRRKRFQYSKR
ncbi:TPA: 30S ribosomal protein S9 [bacterium]|nr:30S ribosomal protein S9 [bacterium]